MSLAEFPGHMHGWGIDGDRQKGGRALPQRAFRDAQAEGGTRDGYVCAAFPSEILFSLSKDEEMMLVFRNWKNISVGR